MSDLFETATRSKLRFNSVRGDLSVEQLWDVPLRSPEGFNLNVLAQTAHRAVRALSEESFVEPTKPNPAQIRAELALDVIKHIIGVKLAEEEAAKTRATRKAEKERLLSILAEKQEGKLSALSEKELARRIAELDE